MTARILVTGVAGYLGSHIAVALAQAGFEVIGFDSLAAAEPQAVSRLRHLCGDRFVFDRIDLRDGEAVLAGLARHRPAAAIHCALLADGAPSPLAYYENNVHGLATLLGAMTAAGLRTLLFASSVAVYGTPAVTPVAERRLPAPRAAHGRSLAACEQMLDDLRQSDSRWRIGVLRVFDMAGSHESGLIGDWRRGHTDVLAQSLDVACGLRESVLLNGGDWPTRDGTRVRDWVHVCDVADGFMRALEALARGTGSFTVNLGSGQGRSELQLLSALEHASRRPLPFRLGERQGGIAEIFAETSRAQTLLGWSARHGIERLCADAWRTRRLNWRGFSEALTDMSTRSRATATAAWHRS